MQYINIKKYINYIKKTINRWGISAGIVLYILTSSNVLLAHGFKIKNLDIAHPYAIATVAGQGVGGVFFESITNHANVPDQLVSASIASEVATGVELHVMNTDDDVMRMRHLSSIELPAHTSIAMTRGLKNQGYHLMLIGLKRPLVVGERLPLRLKFEKAGTVEVLVYVEAFTAQNQRSVPQESDAFLHHLHSN